MQQKCPISHTDRFMGAYFPDPHKDVRTIAYDTEHFSSRRIIVREVRAASSRRRITSAALVEGKDQVKVRWWQGRGLFPDQPTRIDVRFSRSRNNNTPMPDLYNLFLKP